MSASTVAEQVAVDVLGPDQFISRINPVRMGNAANIAYGGCAISITVRSAIETVGEKYLLYSALGNYLGPALADRPLKTYVRRVRDTRTFATRFVEVVQELDDGSSRVCMTALLDFQVREGSMFVYSDAGPTSTPAESSDPRVLAEELVRKGVVTQNLADFHKAMFEPHARFFESRAAPDSVSGANMQGVAKKAKTPQDDVPLPSKTSTDWFRARHDVPTKADAYASLAFLLDGALSFLPLTHNNLFLNDSGPCSTLDFALRFFRSDFDLNGWNVRQMRTIAGGDGRTYSEARVWDGQGNLVANMTQQSILRPKPMEKTAAKASL